MKKLIIGLVIGLMLGLSTNAFAISDSIQAVYAQFNYKVNGTAQPGVTALVYDGTSYLRTTDLANMLGYDVTYRANSRTIEFSKPEPTPAPSIVPVPTTDLNVVQTPIGEIPSPTPVPSATPDPVSGIVPTPDPNATPAPSASPTPSPVPTPVPPSNPGGEDNRYSYCQSLPRDSAMFLIYQCSAYGL